MALDLSKIDVEEFLNELGMNNIRQDGKDFWYSCFSDQHYRGDVNPSASMEQGTTRFYCFSCGMHGNAISFLSELENVSPIQAAIWVKERFGGGTVPQQETILDNVKEILNKKKTTKTIYKFPEIDESEADRRILDWDKLWKEYELSTSQLTHLPGETWEDIFQEQPEPNPMFYMFDRGFTPDILNEWKVGWDKISERFSIPIRNENGRLIGFKGRTIKGNPRYIVLGGPEYGFETYQTKKILFGLNKINNNSELIVCEGELNVIAMHQKGFKNTVGISGKILSVEHVELIKKYGQKVILIFDEEEDAINNAKKLRRYMPTSIVPSHEKDPAEMDATEIRWLLQSKKSSLIQ